MNRFIKALFEPIISQNPISVGVLGICSVLAVTIKLQTTLIMCISVIFVLAMSNFFISILRKHMVSEFRIIMEMVVIATLVIFVEQVLKTYYYSISKELSVYVGLIITNCIILGRAEAYALKNPPFISLLDGLGNGIGYSLILLIVAFIRELFGTGKIFNITVLKTVEEGGLYVPNGLLLLAPGAFFIMGFIVWTIRTFKKDQQEKE